MSVTALDELHALLGPRGMLTAPDQMLSYETGARYDRGHVLHVVAQAGNTGLVSGSTPDDSGRQVVLSVERLIAFDPAQEAQLRDWVIEVTCREFGGSFSAEHALGRKNQHWYDLYTPEPQRRLAHALPGQTAPAGLGVVKFG
ncbi:MAG: hypothetical protein D1H97_19225 [Paracoccus sp. BP8]|nr:MAG: hypothetical protein D1H97_19225 [Paracoccus sp. BP8]